MTLLLWWWGRGREKHGSLSYSRNYFGERECIFREPKVHGSWKEGCEIITIFVAWISSSQANEILHHPLSEYSLLPESAADTICSYKRDVTLLYSQFQVSNFWKRDKFACKEDNNSFWETAHYCMGLACGKSKTKKQQTSDDTREAGEDAWMKGTERK